MSYILSIDTAVETSSVCLSFGEDVLSVKTNPVQKDSAAWIQPAIQTLLKDQGIAHSQLSAIAISNGPGSYTGLRVGMATAKGLSYALGIPLITIGTLKMMTVAALKEKADLYCPMIDARRMEVFTGLYDERLNEITAAHNLILNETSLSNELETNNILFFGNGSVKFKSLISHKNAQFSFVDANAKHLAALAFEAFSAQNFADLAYSEPTYGKEFYSPPPKSLL